jgi:hypothetical protein
MTSKTLSFRTAFGEESHPAKKTLSFRTAFGEESHPAKKTLSFRTAFGEESHPAKQRSPTLLLVILQKKRRSTDRINNTFSLIQPDEIPRLRSG